MLGRKLYNVITYNSSKLIIYTIDILSGLLANKLKFFEVLECIYLINMEFLQFLIIE